MILGRVAPYALDLVRFFRFNERIALFLIKLSAISAFMCGYSSCDLLDLFYAWASSGLDTDVALLSDPLLIMSEENVKDWENQETVQGIPGK